MIHRQPSESRDAESCRRARLGFRLSTTRAERANGVLVDETERALKLQATAFVARPLRSLARESVREICDSSVLSSRGEHLTGATCRRLERFTPSLAWRFHLDAADAARVHGSFGHAPPWFVRSSP